MCLNLLLRSVCPALYWGVFIAEISLGIIMSIKYSVTSVFLGISYTITPVTSALITATSTYQQKIAPPAYQTANTATLPPWLATNASPTTSSTPPPPLAITSPLSSWHPPYPPPTPSRSSTGPSLEAVLSSSTTKNYWSPTALIPPTAMSVTALPTPQSLTLPSAGSSILASLLLPWIPPCFST